MSRSLVISIHPVENASGLVRLKVGIGWLKGGALRGDLVKSALFTASRLV